MRSQAVARRNSPFVAVGPRERAGILGVAVLLMGLVGALNLTQGRWDLALIFVACVIYIFILVLPVVVDRDEWGWFHPIIFLPLWTLVTDVVPSFDLYIHGLEQHVALPGLGAQGLNRLVLEALLLQSAAWLAFYAGVGTGRPASLRFNFPQRTSRGIPSAICIVAVVSLVALIVFIHEAGGLGELMLQRGRPEVNIGEELGGEWVFLARYFLPLTCLVWLSLQPRMASKVYFWLLLGAGLLMGFAVTGSRSAVVFPLIMAFCIWMLATSRMPYLRIVLIGASVLMVVGLGGEFRYASGSADTLGRVNVEGDPLSWAVQGFHERMSARSKTSPLIAILGKVPDEIGLLHGRSYLAVAGAPIPSGVWPQKPEVGGQLTARNVFGRPEQAGGKPPGGVGEAFWNFHVPGVLIIYFLWGRFVVWIASLYRDNASLGGASALYVISIIALSPNSNAIYTWMQLIIGGLVALSMLCGRSPIRGIWPPLRRS